MLICFVSLGLLPAQEGSNDPLPDPVPVQRLHLPPEKLPQVLAQDKGGILKELPRLDFEAKMQQAAKAKQQPAPEPSLVKAEYAAQLAGYSLVGQGSWTVYNPENKPAILSLKDARLALANVKIEGAPAVVGILTGSENGLLLPPQAGQKTIQFDWSLAGGVNGGETYFELQFPSCVSSILELNLPAECVVEAMGKGNLLAGPVDAGNGLRRWKLGTSKTKLSFKIHRTKGAGAMEPLQLVQVKSEQTLLPNRLEAEFEFNIEVLNNVIQELAFDWDFPAPPTKVSWDKVELKDWDVVDQPAAAGTAKKALLIRFNEPKKFDRLKPLSPLHISCQVPLPKGERWTSPGLKLRGAVSLLETLTLRIHPDVQLAQWHPGSFQLVKAEKDAAGFDTLALEETGAPAVKRPSATVQLQKPQGTVKQVVWWQVGQKDSTVLAKLTYQVHQGKFQQLTVGLPKNWGKGWQLQTVDVLPKGLARKYALIHDGGQPRLVVELERGITSAEKVPVELKVGFRFPHPASPLLDFPQLQPLDSVSLQGTLGVSVDSVYQASALQTTAAASVIDEQGPWLNTPLNFFYTYRDLPLTGKLRLLPQLPQFQAACASQVFLVGQKAELLVRLQLEPVAGTPDTLDVYVSAPLVSKLKLKNAVGQPKIVSVERLPGLEAILPVSALGTLKLLNAAALLGAAPRGEFWRIKLAQPLAKQETLLLGATFSPEATGPVGSMQWEVPVLTVVNALRPEGDLSLDAAGMKVTQSQSQGLKLLPAAGGGQGARPHWQYAPSLATGTVPRLWLETQPSSQLYKTPQEQFGAARLISYISPEGKLTHQFFFQVRDWGKPVLPVELPTTATLLYAKRQGKWIENNLGKKEGGVLRLDLPADPKKKWQWFEIAYTSEPEAANWLLWTRTAAPVPKLPAGQLAFSHSWKLPPGIVPLNEKKNWAVFQSNQTDGGKITDWWFAAEKIHGWFTEAGTRPAWENQQRQEWQDAAQKWSRQNPNFLGRLDIALASLAGHLPAGMPLVVDVQALQAIGVGPETLVAEDAVAFWEKIGLVYLPIKGAALLTTKTQAQSWFNEQQQSPLVGRLANPSYDDKGEISRAVKAAAEIGYDPTGRFQTVAAWASQFDGPEVMPAPDFFSWGQEPGWTDWRPLAGASVADGFYLVNRPNLNLLGGVLSALAAVVLWRLGSSLAPAWQFRLLLLWTALVGVCLVGLPVALRVAVYWPAWIGLAVLAVNFFLRSAGRGKQLKVKGSPSDHALGRIVGLFFCVFPCAFLLVPFVAVGQGPSFKVYILGSADGPAERQKVLAPAALLQKLDQLNQPAAAKMNDAVLVNAAYQGSVKDGWAIFQVDFQVYCSSAQATLNIPLKGVQLLPERESKLQNLTVYPLPAGPQGGYTLPIEGYKDQFVQLTMFFKTRLQGKADVPEINFSIPRLLQNRLILDLPANAQSIRALSALGRQQTVEQKGASRLEADLGPADLGQLGESLLSVRWYQLAAAPKKAEVEVSEFHLSDLRPAKAGLVSVLKYVIQQGSVSQLHLLLPEQLHLRTLEVRKPDEKTPLLKGWKISQQAAGKILEVELETPVSGTVHLALEFVAAAGTKKSLALMLPTPLEGKSSGGLIACLEEQPILPGDRTNLSITPIDPKTFSTEWSVLGKSYPGNLQQTYRFQRLNSKLLAGLQFNFNVGQPRVVQKIEWDLHPDYAKVHATLTLEDCAGSTYLEWEVPAALTIAQLNGPALLRWTVAPAGAKKILQIWLANTGGNTYLGLTGWLTQPIKPGPFVLPRLVLVAPKLCPTTIQVKAVPGLVPRPFQAKQLTLDADQPNLTFKTTQPDYSATLIIESAPVKTQVQILTQAQRHEGMVKVTAFVHCTIPVGELQKLTVVAHNWQAGDPQLEATRAKDIAKKLHPNKDISWVLQFPPGTTQQYTLKLVGTFPLPAGGELPMPALDVTNAEVVQNWLAIAGEELQAGGHKGLILLQDPAKHLTLWSAQAEQIQQHGQLWQIKDKDWRLQLLPQSPPAKKTLHILAAEQTITTGEGGGWLCQADYLLAAETETSLHFNPPAGASLLAVRLDGQEIPPLLGGETALTLPAGAHRLLVRWTFAEPVGQKVPPLQPLQIQGVDHPAVLYTLRVPPGYQLSPGMQSPAGVNPVSACAAHLYHAAGCLQQTTALATRLGADINSDLNTELMQAQKAFYWNCRQANHCLQQGLTAPGDKGPNGQSLDEWRKSLEKENFQIAKKYNFETQRKIAEAEPGPANSGISTLAPLPAGGTPLHWLISESAVPDFRLALTPIQSLPLPAQLLQILLVLLLAGLMLSFVPGGVKLVRWLWPEQLFALAAVGIALLGVSLLAVLLLLFALAARLSWMVRQFRKLLRRPTAAAPSSSG